MDLFTGKFQHEKSENLDKYYESIGIPFIVRKVLNNISPTHEFSRHEDNWEMKSKSTFESSAVKFKLGEEFEESFPGVEFKSVATLKDNELTITSVKPDGVKVIRKFQFDETHCILVLIDEVTGTEAKRYFKRIM